MKKKFLSLMVSFGFLVLCSMPANAIRPIEDLRTPGQIENQVIEKHISDISAASQESSPTVREQEVAEIQKLLRLDELDRRNTMAEALKQEQLEDLIVGHKDIELAMAEKNVDLHMGKVLTDIHGQRVRMEEYVLRPAPDQVQFLNLSLRSQRLDYIDYNAYFSDVLPQKTRGLWRKEFGKEKPEIYLVRETRRHSNLMDSVDYGVKYFDPTWVTEIQQYVLPQEETTLHVNDLFKFGQNRPTPDVDFTEMEEAEGLKSYEFEFIDQNVWAHRIKLTFNDDTFLQLEKYLISEDGDVRCLRNWEDLVYWINHFDEFVFNTYKEQILTASEFSGRTIDTVSQFIHLANIFVDDDCGRR
jgi:hypothetical protein